MEELAHPTSPHSFSTRRPLSVSRYF
jgi:hypothetical protein